MTDDEFKAAFRQLDSIEPSPGFLQATRSIPLRLPRPDGSVSLWEIFRRRSRVATLAVSALCGVGVGYLTLDQSAEGTDGDLAAFLNSDTDDALFAGAVDADWGSP